MKLYYNRLTPTVFASTTAAAGYPATNIGRLEVLRPWRGTGLGAEDVVLQLPVVATMQALLLHDVNFSSATIERSVNGVAWNAVGAMPTYSDNHGRRRGLIVINTAGQLATRIRIAAGVSTDGLGYWRIGAGHLFGSALPMAALPEFGYRVATRRPRTSLDLPNGRTAVATTGANVDRIEFNFARQPSEQLEDFIQQTSAGICAIDMELANWPHQRWPVRLIEPEVGETFAKKAMSTVPVTLTEIA